MRKLKKCIVLLLIINFVINILSIHSYAFFVSECDGYRVTYYTDVQNGETVISSIGISARSQTEKEESSGVFTLASEIDGFKVVGLNSAAFAGYKFSEIVLPNTLSSINENAFEACKYLRK